MTHAFALSVVHSGSPLRVLPRLRIYYVGIHGTLLHFVSGTERGEVKCLPILSGVALFFTVDLRDTAILVGQPMETTDLISKLKLVGTLGTYPLTLAYVFRRLCEERMEAVACVARTGAPVRRVRRHCM